MASSARKGSQSAKESDKAQEPGGSEATPATTATSPPENSARKKQKFSRAKTACLPCRARKSKCGALPPEPCQNCLDWGLECVWPSADGRSSQARIQRAKSANLAAAEKQSAPDTASTDNTQPPDWLESMLAGGVAGPSTGFTPLGASPSTGFSHPTSSSIDLPGPSTYQTHGGGFMPGFDASYAGMFNGSHDAIDPTGFMWAVSSQLPTVQESSPADDRVMGSGPSPQTGRSELERGRDRQGGEKSEGKIVKISWWRPHGQTAIAPGLKRITLKVRVDHPFDPASNPSPHPSALGAPEQDIIAPDGAPSTGIMKHLLGIFMIHFGCQFPFIDKHKVEQEIESRTASVFLMNCIAGLAARFSTHPGIALPHLEPSAYGNVFYHRAKALLGSMLSVPSREVIAGFVMLAHISFANDSESELWMLTGMAVRMSIDLGLHINPPEESTISQEDRRLNRLVFFAVLLMDNALAFGVGRQTTFRVEDITQTLPADSDIPVVSGEGMRSPFSFAAQMMLSYGPLINMLNREQGDGSQNDQDIQAALMRDIRAYNQLPQDMQWNVGNLQKHCRYNQGPIFLHLHLWMHTILASGHLTGTNLPRRGQSKPMSISTSATPNSATASTLWRNSVRTIGDILVLSDIINPQAYLAIPFTNQAFFVASCCYVNEIDQNRSRPSSPTASPRHPSSGLTMSTIRAEEKPSEGGSRQVDLSRALLTSVARTNIATLQNGLAKQAEYWSGVAWVMAALEKRIEGFQDVDLEGVTEKLKSFVSMPDAGLLGRAAAETGVLEQAAAAWTNAGAEAGQVNYNDLDFLSLPFDLGAAEGVNAVTQTEIPLSQGWQSNWFK